MFFIPNQHSFFVCRIYANQAIPKRSIASADESKTAHIIMPHSFHKKKQKTQNQILASISINYAQKLQSVAISE